MLLGERERNLVAAPRGPSLHDTDEFSSVSDREAAMSLHFDRARGHWLVRWRNDVSHTG